MPDFQEGALPVQSPEFWKERLLKTISNGHDLHKAIYQIDYKIWQAIQERTAHILEEYIKPGERVLDAGCGIGSLYPLIPTGVQYLGVDISEYLIDIARTRHPKGNFIVGSIACLPGHPPKDHYDWVVCRSLRDMVRRNQGQIAWDPIERELRRVGKNVLIIEYEGEVTAEVIKSCR